ncbi:hypothetical protein [Mesorhizobium sp. ANAO-SY3R2]|uniref:hypothetical protein n=1 Tax=Mesorhizobium sp. ANAO-SY3R2 TaxID=3166644 RepID=UPI00366C8C03
MAEPSNRDDEWRRKHSLLARWQDDTANTLRNTSLLSIVVDEHDEADVVDPATLHRMARFCRERERAAPDAVAEAVETFRPELRTEPFEAAYAPEPAVDAPHPDPSANSQLLAAPVDYPWQPAPSSATHLEPSAPASQIDEISESLREVRNELNLLRERRARRYF